MYWIPTCARSRILVVSALSLNASSADTKVLDWFTWYKGVWCWCLSLGRGCLILTKPRLLLLYHILMLQYNSMLALLFLPGINDKNGFKWNMHVFMGWWPYMHMDILWHQLAATCHPPWLLSTTWTSYFFISPREKYLKVAQGPSVLVNISWLKWWIFRYEPVTDMK